METDRSRQNLNTIIDCQKMAENTSKFALSINPGLSKETKEAVKEVAISDLKRTCEWGANTGSSIAKWLFGPNP